MPWIFLTPYEFQQLCRYAHGFFQTSKLMNHADSQPTLSELEEDFLKMEREIAERNDV